MAAGRRSPVVPVLLFTLVCAVVMWFVLYLLGRSMRAANWWMLGYFGVVALVLHIWQERALDTDPKGFIRRFMLGLVVKLLVTLFLMVILIQMVGDADAAATLIAFVLLYLAFLGFSTARLAGLLRDRSNT